MENIKHIIESLLFVTESPLTVDSIKRVLLHAETAEIREALSSLSREYDARKGGFYLNEVAGGFQLRTRTEFTEWIRRLLQPKQQRMSKPALETLAIIAYKQPVIRSDIEHIRGVDSGGILRTLLEKKLIRILGRRKIPGRPLIYATTKLFLEIFDLKDLKELPTPKEIDALEEEADPADGQAGGEVDPNQMQLFETQTASDSETIDEMEPAESSTEAVAEDDTDTVQEPEGPPGETVVEDDGDTGNEPEETPDDGAIEDDAGREDEEGRP